MKIVIMGDTEVWVVCDTKSLWNVVLRKIENRSQDNIKNSLEQNDKSD